MENKNKFFTIALGLLCVISIFSALFMFMQAKSIETEYLDKEADFIRENMDMSDRVDNLRNIISEKTSEIEKIGRQSKSLEKRVISISEEKEKLHKLFENQTYTLKEEKKELQNQLTALNKLSFIELIRKAKDVEENESIKKLMERTLQNIEGIRSGKVVDLEPIVVSQEAASSEETQATIGQEGAMPVVIESISGEVLSIDKKNNLIVVSLGTKDKIDEGQRLLILNENEEIASAEVISARYGISAAFIGDIKYKHTVGEIKNGFNVIIAD